jgi:hypothetical protein
MSLRRRLIPRQTQEEIMEIPKDQILQLLRDRGDHDKADQADQQVPDRVDPDQRSDLRGSSGSTPAN